MIRLFFIFSGLLYRTTSRNYIPSPLGTPKRMAQKLGNQLSNSPILSRRTWHRVDGSSSLPSSSTSPASVAPTSNQAPAMNSSSSSSNSSKSSTNGGFFSFLTSAMPMLSKRQVNKNHSKNLFLDPKMHTDYEDTLELHQFSDSGRIANRYDNMRWDAWYVDLFCFVHFWVGHSVECSLIWMTNDCLSQNRDELPPQGFVIRASVA